TATVYAYAKAGDAFADLRSRRVDAFVGDAVTSAWFASRYESEVAISFEPSGPDERFAWALRNRDSELGTLANETLADWRRDGTLEGMRDDWRPPLPTGKRRYPPRAGP